MLVLHHSLCRYCLTKIGARAYGVRNVRGCAVVPCKDGCITTESSDDYFTKVMRFVSLNTTSPFWPRATRRYKYTPAATCFPF
jgi:hypothetical protein